LFFLFNKKIYKKGRKKKKGLSIVSALYKGTHPWSMNKNPLKAHVHILRKEKNEEKTISSSSVQRILNVYKQKWKKENVLTVSCLLQTLKTMLQNIQT